MPARLNIPSIGEKFVTDQGFLTLIWHRFFADVQTVLNSSLDTDTQLAMSNESSGSNGGVVENLETKGLFSDSSNVKIETLIESMFNTTGDRAVSTIERITSIIDTDSPYTVLLSDIVIFADTTSAVITVNLPYGVEGMYYKIINCGSGGYALTVDPNGVQELYGSGAGVASVLVDGEVIDIHFNSTKGWY